MMKSRWCVMTLAISAVVAGLACGETQTPPVTPSPAPPASTQATAAPTPWVDSFDLTKCAQLTTGSNSHFILEPGFQLVLANGQEQVAITVLGETNVVNGIVTRVVEEREWENGELKEVSRNYFTICKEHNDVFYHGEDVDDYENGKVVNHGGAWLAGTNGARAGLLLPGTPTLGYRHYQEVAPGIAMDRAEVVALDAVVECPAGEFKNCLKVVESSELEPGHESHKVYAPGVGLVFDDGMALIDSGINRMSPREPLTVPASTEKE